MRSYSKPFFVFAFFAIGLVISADAAPRVSSVRPGVTVQSARSRISTAGLQIQAPIPVVPALPVFDGTCANPAPEQLDALRCTQRYFACLRRDMVCGEHFELCDTIARFNQRRMFCQDELARCPATVIAELFGNPITQTVDAENMAMCDGQWTVVRRDFTPGLHDIQLAFNASLGPNQLSGIGREIWAGAEWAAANTLRVCESVANACLTRACRNEPHKCLGRQFLLPQVADIAGLASDETERTHAGIATERARFVVPPTLVRNYAENMLWEDANVMQYLRAECGSEIGTNEHCFRLANPNSRFGSSDQFEANLAFDTVMTGEINRRAWVQARSIEWLAAAVAEVVTSCELAIEDCVKNTCGFGSMASCYGRARNRDGLVNLAAGTVNDEIARICRPQIAENQHCRDLRPAGESATAVWTHFWGAGAESTRLSARLSSQLQNAFSETGKANMRRACQTAATACVRQECGNDFTRCLVRGADDDTGRREFNNDGRPIIAGAQAGGFSQDMARGLCMLTVKEIRACNDWFDIQFAESAMTESGQWGALDSWTAGRDARNAWGGDNRTHVCVLERMPMIEAEVQAIGDMRMFRNLGVAARRADVSENDFGCAMQGRRIFDELIADIAAEAQQRLIVAANEAKNQCLDRNRVRGLQDNFVWANVSDLRDRFNPVQGILVQDIRPTADIWDGFCAVRITMNSDDTILNNHLSGVMASRNVRYFSVGDAAVCGSWMSQSDLESLEDAVRAANPQSRVQKGTSGRWMGAITGILGGGAGGIAVGNMIGNAGARDNCTTRGGTSACNMCGHQIRGTDAGDVDDRVWYTCDISIIGNEVVVSNRETSREPPVSEGGGGRIGDTFIASTLRGCNDAVDNLLNQCNAGNRNRTMQLGRHGITGGLVGAAGLGAVGLIAGNQIDVARQRTAQEEERLKQDAAVAEWFNTIGSRINCFIDGRQVGRFGDPIEIR